MPPKAYIVATADRIGSVKRVSDFKEELDAVLEDVAAKGGHIIAQNVVNLVFDDASTRTRSSVGEHVVTIAEIPDNPAQGDVPDF